MKTTFSTSDYLNQVQTAQAISSAYRNGDYEQGYALEQSAELQFGHDWRFLLNLYERELPTAKAVADQLHEAKVDILLGKMAKCSSESEWLSLVAEQRELELLATDTLQEEYWLLSDEQSLDCRQSA